MESRNSANGNVHSFGKLGWIGLGHMGSRIAKRLRNAGYALIIHDRTARRRRNWLRRA